jgi:DNA-binding response OmpR family regulator
MEVSTKKKVLVVDDDSNLRNVLVDALKIAGFDVTEAENGEVGLKVATETHPDVIMLDVMMPKMNGWQMLERLRMDAWGKEAKVIMLTSLGEMNDIAHAVDKKVFTYIVKSDLNLNAVGDIINSTINNKLI